MKVKRKSGAVEDFVREKIVVAVIKAGGKVDLARAIAQETEKEFGGRDVVATQEIRQKILDKLKARDAATYSSWVKYDETKN